MDLRQLKHFVAVFERGNLSKAAEAIPLSQPALTRSVKTLEDQLGVELFDRHARGATPTAAGERLYHHAKSILAECARARRDAAQPIGELSGTVSIGIGALFADEIFDEIIGRFCRNHRNVVVQVKQGYFEELINLIDLGQIEIAFINFPLLSLPESMEFEPLVEVGTSVFVSADHPLATSKNVSMKDLSECLWASVDQPHATEVLDSLFLSEGVPRPRPCVQANSLTLIKSLVLRSGFAGLLPEHLFQAEVDRGSVVRLTLPSTPLIRSAGLIRRIEAFRRPVAEALADEIRRTTTGSAERSSEAAG